MLLVYFWQQHENIHIIGICASFKHHSLKIVATVSVRFQHDSAPQLKSSQTGFLNMTMSLLHLNDLHNH